MLNNWKKLTKVIQSIWKCWSNNYLSTLQQRNKWYYEKNIVEVDTMVLIREGNTPVCNWPLGRIIETLAGKDNKSPMTGLCSNTSKLDDRAVE
ncbi:hypothetical protein X975_15956, partial [Stegodyphus mimosarum]